MELTGQLIGAWAISEWGSLVGLTSIKISGLWGSLR